MSDPTVITLQVCFLGALAVFALSAAVRAAAATRRAGEPPPVPMGRVATWPYVHVDLLWMGFIFLAFYTISVGSARLVADKAVTPISSQSLLGSIAVHLVLAGMTVMVMVWRIRPVDWLGLRWAKWKQAFLIGPLGLLAMWLLSNLLNAAGYLQWMKSLGVEPMQDSVKLLQQSQDPLTLGLMAVAAVVTAPLCEEIVFRGYLYPAAKKFAGPWVAGLASALVFAAAHAGLAPLLPLFYFGCLLTLAYELTGSLWAPVAMHFCLNATTVLVETLTRVYDLPLNSGP